MSERQAKRTAKKTAKSTEPTRRRRSDKEKAQEALRVATDRVDALKDRRDRLAEEHRAVDAEYASAVKRRDYLAMDPALEEVSGADDANGPVEGSGS